MYLIGVDGGGTKTLFTLFDENGKVIKNHVEGTCHFAQVGYDGLKEVIDRGIKTVSEGLNPQEVYIGLGLAGYGREASVRKNIENSLSEILYTDHWCVTSDIDIALKGALNNQPGILVIAGTGSIAMANLGNETIRTGGWGYLVGDEGSAFWIGKKVLEVFSKQSDGRKPKTALYDLIKKDLHLDNDADLVSYVINHQKREEIAKFALYCFEAAKKEDQVAIALYHQVAREIALMINTLAKNYETKPIQASYVGGVFKAQEYLIPYLESCLDEGIHFQAPLFPPEYGAYLMAKQLIR